MKVSPLMLRFRRDRRQVSVFSSAAGLKSGQFNRERNSKKENIEFRIMNIECRMNEFCPFKKTARHAAQAPALREQNHPSIFCGSIFAILRFAVPCS